jgi:threonine dehydrogenase-like Zn-dependent dehydrogenase
MTDEQALFLGDIFPTGWMAADNCEIEPADIVAVWGCGPVGQFCTKSALMLALPGSSPSTMFRSG